MNIDKLQMKMKMWKDIKDFPIFFDLKKKAYSFIDKDIVRLKYVLLTNSDINAFYLVNFDFETDHDIVTCRKAIVSIDLLFASFHANETDIFVKTTRDFSPPKMQVLTSYRFTQKLFEHLIICLLNFVQSKNFISIV